MATQGQTLFQLPIKGPDISSPDSSIICTTPKDQVYLLTFNHAPDNRIPTSFCQTLLLALDIIEHRYPAGVVITTSSIPKFYSNGMDIEHSQFSRDYFPNSLYALWRRLLTYPMPTVALVNGHAFAGGMMVAMFHDYRVMNPHKGYLCLNELELGMPLRAPMMSVFREKLTPVTLRKMVLEAHRFAALEALKENVVDHLGGLPETLAFIDETKLVQKAQLGLAGRSSYAELKTEMWRESVAFLDDWAGGHVKIAQDAERVGRDREAGERKVKEWERESKAGKSKL